MSITIIKYPRPKLIEIKTDSPERSPMAILTKEIREMADKTETWVISTVNDDGTPRTIPVRLKKLLPGDEMIIADFYMKTTLHNLKARPDKVAVTFWEPGVFHITGEARSESSGALYDQCVELGRARHRNAPKSVIVIKATSAQIWHRPR